MAAKRQRLNRRIVVTLERRNASELVAEVRYVIFAAEVVFGVACALVFALAVTGRSGLSDVEVRNLDRIAIPTRVGAAAMVLCRPAGVLGAEARTIGRVVPALAMETALPQRTTCKAAIWVSTILIAVST